VYARHGELSYALDVAPPGMTVSKTGVVQWDVPAQRAAGNVRVAITVRDGKGKESLHVFDLVVE
jgi:hypothetical protein